MLYQDHGSYMLVLSDSLASRISSSKGLIGKCENDEDGEESNDDESQGESISNDEWECVVVMVGSVAAAAAAATFWIDFGDMVLVEYWRSL
ncbi:hypothetical protein CTI12_AA578110 [Artemisia annua]|uniref:Uncharacterized protein n=1 Tax=Artemisia annua TaxID=35608 RepID=A0A2U1KQ02_ARTAN|nr:hypothetical protein CTI12_AA578110 [Artemisia annua]